MQANFVSGLVNLKFTDIDKITALFSHECIHELCKLKCVNEGTTGNARFVIIMQHETCFDDYFDNIYILNKIHI